MTGCQITDEVPADATPQDIADENILMRQEVKTLREELSHQKDLRKIMAQYEDRVARLEAVIEPLTPVKENNMAVMANNKKNKRKLVVVHYRKYFTSFKQLMENWMFRLLAWHLKSTTLFTEDFIQENLYSKLEDKVVDVSLKIAEITVRRSKHMAADRRLVTSRLKALNESFMALRNLADNKVFDLSINQHKNLFEKSDAIRIEYAKIFEDGLFSCDSSISSFG